MLIVAVSTSTLNIRIREQEMLRVREQEKLRSESEKERMRGNLLRAISHDLRTPLTAISGAAAVLLSSAMALGYAPVLLVAGLCVGALSCVLSKALFAAMPKNAPGRVNQYKLFKK